MRNLLVEMQYNGANYHGYQVQANALTITEVVQNAIEKVLHKREKIVGCSRTDSRVHANSYFFNMRTESKIPCDKFVRILNNALPNDILILDCKDVDEEFHARYCCKGKEYIYKIYNAPEKNPFNCYYALHHATPIDEKRLNEAAQVFVGTHNFTSFCSLGYKEGIPMTKTVEYISVYREGDYVYLKIKADGFLYNMVRIIVGTLLYVNDGKIKAEDLPEILEKKDRNCAGKTASPYGLYLNKVEY